MEVTSATSTAASGPTSTGQTALSSDFETFLRLLTTQMQNQDPLNPMESTEFATQLATFSSVEQQVLTNNILEAMQAQINGMGLSQLAGWVGMEAKVLAAGYFDGSPVDLVTYPLDSADRADLVVTDAGGNEVARIAISTESETMRWDGLDGDGNPLPHGLYDFTVESFVDGEIADVLPAEVFAEIQEARAGSQGIILVLEGGVNVLSTDVTGLRSAG